MSDMSGGIGIPVAIVIFVAVIVVAVTLWSRRSGEPQTTGSSFRERFRRVSFALGVGIVGLLIGVPGTNGARRSLAAWLALVVVTFGSLLIGLSAVWRWTRADMSDEVYVALLRQPLRDDSPSERRKRIQFVAAFILLVIASTLLFRWSIDHLIF